MSWIESHQSLSHHRKLVKAQRLLKCDKHKLIGHLHELWWWGLDNASDDGEIVDVALADIALAAQWNGRVDPDRFGLILIECGFIDTDATQERYWLHDWWHFAGKLNAKRAKDRERKSQGSSADFHRNSSGSSAEVAGTYLPTNQPSPDGEGAREAALPRIGFDEGKAQAFAATKGYGQERVSSMLESFTAFWESRGWRDKAGPVRDRDARWRTWVLKEIESRPPTINRPTKAVY